MAVQKIKLTLYEVEELVAENKYEASEKSARSRCIDGRYVDDQDSALAYPGADLGELALMYATANQYGFTIDKDKAFDTYVQLIGGARQFVFHTDHHAEANIPAGGPARNASQRVAGGCGFIKNLRLDPKTFFLTDEDVKKLDTQAEIMLKKGAQQIILEEDHREAAVIMVEGEYGVYPQFNVHTDHGVKMVQVFVYHHTLVNARHKELAKALIAAKAVELPEKCDEEYLYEALSDVAEQHLMEIAKRLAKGLPIYRVIFKGDGMFTIHEEGEIPE